jgi:hypothetical protein
MSYGPFLLFFFFFFGIIPPIPEGLAKDTSNSAKILDVLCKINERLEHLDHRLQTVQELHHTQGQSSQQLVGDTSAQAQQGRIRHDNHFHESSCYRSFDTKETRTVGGELEIVQIIITDKDLLSLLKRVSKPCPHTAHPKEGEDDEENRGVLSCDFPFPELIALCGTISCIQRRGSQDAEIWGEVLSLGEISDKTLKDIDELTDVICKRKNSREYYKEFCKAIKTGIACFRHLPSLFTPGTLLVDSQEPGKRQFVEVTSCEALPTEVSPDCYRVEYWRLRWDGRQFARVGGNFEIQRYTGVRHFDQLPFRPILQDFSAESLLSTVQRCEDKLEVYKTFSKTENGEFPLRLYIGGLPDDKDNAVGLRNTFAS